MQILTRFARDAYAFGVILLLVISAPAVADTYGSGGLSFDTATQPDPGFSSFSTLATGINSVLYNPAALMRGGTAEVSLAFDYPLKGSAASHAYPFKITDQKITEEANIIAGVYFTDDLSDTTTFKTREASAMVSSSRGGGITSFGTAFRFTDFFAFGISRNREAAFGINAQGYHPTIAKATVNLRGMDLRDSGNGVIIRDDGYLEFYQGGFVTTSDAQVWNDFLSQEAVQYLKNNVNLETAVSGSNDFVITTASKFGPVAMGINLIPVSISGSFTEHTTVIIDQSTGYVVYYTPKIGPNTSSTEAQEWCTNPLKYGTENGYDRNTIRVPEGEIIGESEISGKYSAEALRLDFGAIWEPHPAWSFGLVLENFNGAKLTPVGYDLQSYIRHRYDKNAVFPTPEAGTPMDWDPWLSSPTYETFTVDSTTLPPELPVNFQTIELPQKIKAGVALKGPLILALDYERWLNRVSVPTSPEASYINGLNFIHLGWKILGLRGEMLALLKPEVTGNPDFVKNINDVYDKVPIVPVKLGGELALPIAGGEFSLGSGLNAMSFLNVLFYDISQITQFTYLNLGYKKGPWSYGYVLSADPFVSAWQSANLSDGKVEMGSIQVAFVHTFTIGYRF